MLMVAHVGVGGVKNGRKHAHVINGRPLSKSICISAIEVFFLCRNEGIENVDIDFS